MRLDHGSRSRLSDGRPRYRAFWCGLVALCLYAPQKCLAQAESISKIDADYQAQRTRLDRERIERLTRLAESQKPDDAESTYLEIFRFAVATDQYADAERAADRVIGIGPTNREVEFLARLVKIIAEADRADFDGSMRDLKSFLSAPAAGPPAVPRVRIRTVLAIGEAYFRRLIQAGRFELAREACDHVVERAGDPAVRDHFLGYRKRLDLIGRPAPPIEGTDVDGTPIRLDDLKGKVVLVVFWATWCPPCAERLPILTHALELHEKEGFTVLGVNLDTEKDREQLVRRFLIEFNVPWPSVMNGAGEQDAASRYGVAEIPANVLIGRDRRVITIDINPSRVLQEVTDALKRPVRSR